MHLPTFLAKQWIGLYALDATLVPLESVDPLKLRVIFSCCIWDNV